MECIQLVLPFLPHASLLLSEELFLLPVEKVLEWESVVSICLNNSNTILFIVHDLNGQRAKQIYLFFSYTTLFLFQ